MNLTQEQLGQKVGVSKVAISLFESGKNIPQNKTLLSIAKHLNTTVDYLLNDKIGNAILPANPYKYAELEDDKNMTIVPVKSFGGFLVGYKNKVYLATLEKISFPFIKGDCYAFEVQDFTMFKSVKDGDVLYKYGYEPGAFVAATKVSDFSWLMKDHDYVFQCSDKLIIRRFDRIENGNCYVYCINKDYNPVDPIPINNIMCVYIIEKTINKPSI